MTSEIARRGSGNPAPAVASTAKMLQPSQVLKDAMWDVEHPHPDAGRVAVPAYVKDEARRVLASIPPAQLATVADWEWFLGPMGILPKQKGLPPVADAVGPIAFALADVPAAALSLSTQRECLRKFEFWPTPANLLEVMAPFIAAANGRRIALQAVLRAPDEKASPPMTDAERLAYAPEARAKVEALKAEFKAQARARAEAEGRKDPGAARLNVVQLCQADDARNVASPPHRIAALEALIRQAEAEGKPIADEAYALLERVKDGPRKASPLPDRTQAARDARNSRPFQRR